MSAFSKYLQSPLDDRYLVVPGDTVEENTLPAEEIEVRRALSELKLMAIQSDDLSLSSKLFKTNKFMDWQKNFNAKKAEVKTLIFSSQLHRAAYHRIKNAVATPGRDSDRTIWDFIKTDEGREK